MHGLQRVDNQQELALPQLDLRHCLKVRQKSLRPFVTIRRDFLRRLRPKHGITAEHQDAEKRSNFCSSHGPA
jgi:hypothetical protein